MDKKLTGLMSVFLLSFALFISLIMLNSNLINTSRATGNLKPSPNNSFILAFPLEISATSQESSITMFVRTEDTKPLSQREVKLTSSIGSIEPSISTTDNDGKVVAQFNCEGSTGIAEISAIISNTVNVSKKVTVQCN